MLFGWNKSYLSVPVGGANSCQIYSCHLAKQFFLNYLGLFIWVVNTIFRFLTWGLIADIQIGLMSSISQRILIVCRVSHEDTSNKCPHKMTIHKNKQWTKNGGMPVREEVHHSAIFALPTGFFGPFAFEGKKVYLSFASRLYWPIFKWGICLPLMEAYIAFAFGPNLLLRRWRGFGVRNKQITLFATEFLMPPGVFQFSPQLDPFRNKNVVNFLKPMCQKLRFEKEERRSGQSYWKNGSSLIEFPFIFCGTFDARRCAFAVHFCLLAIAFPTVFWGFVCQYLFWPESTIC